MVEKDIQNQESYTKHSLKRILSNIVTVVGVWAIILCVVVFVSGQYEHPDDWRRTSITLSHTEMVKTRYGYRLDLYDDCGNCYIINRNETNIAEVLEIGQEYTFTYSDNHFNDIVEEIWIDGVEYLDYTDSVQEYWNLKIFWWILMGLIIVMAIVNSCISYKADNGDGIKEKVEESNLDPWDRV